MLIRRLLYYLNPVTLFRKGVANRNLRMMHGVNRISIFMFLICLIVLCYRWFLR